MGKKSFCHYIPLQTAHLITNYKEISIEQPGHLDLTRNTKILQNGTKNNSVWDQPVSLEVNY